MAQLKQLIKGNNPFADRGKKKQSHQQQKTRRTFPCVSAPDLMAAIKKLPGSTEFIVQTASVKVGQGRNLVDIPTLLSFDRSGKRCHASSFSQLAQVLESLTLKDINDPVSHAAKCQKLFRASTSEADQYHDQALFLLVIPTTSKILVSWKRGEHFTKEDVKEFMSDKGFVQLPRYTIKKTSNG